MVLGVIKAGALSLPLISCTLGKADLVPQLDSTEQLTLVTGRRVSWPEGMNVGQLTLPANFLLCYEMGRGEMSYFVL